MSEEPEPLTLTPDEEPSTREAKKLAAKALDLSLDILRLESAAAQRRMELANLVNLNAPVLSNDAAFEEMIVVLRALAEVAR